MSSRRADVGASITSPVLQLPHSPAPDHRGDVELHQLPFPELFDEERFDQPFAVWVRALGAPRQVEVR